MLNFINTLLKNNQNAYVFKYLIILELLISKKTPLSLIKNCSFPALQLLFLRNDDDSPFVNISLEALHNKFDYL